jgi:hypothetical protein
MCFCPPESPPPRQPPAGKVAPAMACFFIGRLDVHIKNTSFAETCFKPRKTGRNPQSRRILANARRRRTRAAEERAQRRGRAAPANERNATGRMRTTTRTTANGGGSRAEADRDGNRAEGEASRIPVARGDENHRDNRSVPSCKRVLKSSFAARENAREGSRCTSTQASKMKPAAHGGRQRTRGDRLTRPDQ